MSNMVHLEEGILSRLKFALAKIYHSGSTTTSGREEEEEYRREAAVGRREDMVLVASELPKLRDVSQLEEWHDLKSFNRAILPWQ